MLPVRCNIYILELHKVLVGKANKSFTYHDIRNSMTLEDNVTLLDRFTHTEQDREKIWNFDFLREQSAPKRVTIVETFCTLVTVGGKYLEKNTFQKVLEKIDKIRKIIRIKSLHIYLLYKSIILLI